MYTHENRRAVMHPRLSQFRAQYPGRKWRHGPGTGVSNHVQQEPKQNSFEEVSDAAAATINGHHAKLTKAE